MRVAIDARTMQTETPGGIGRSLANLLPLLREQVDVHLLTDSHEQPISTDLPQTPLLSPVPGVHASWLQLSASRWLRTFSGVFHCPFYALPHRLPVPGVATIHDITYEHHREWFSRRQGMSFRVQSRRAAQTGAAILTVSEFVKQDIVNAYQVDPERVLVAPQGIDPVFSPDRDPGPVLERLGVHRPYFVAVGGAIRRNLPLAVEVWRTLVRAGAEVDLVVVGNEEPRPEVGLTWAGRVPDPDWAALLSGSVALLYPTAYEGFGMPALEALGAGTTVIAAPVGSLPEVLGEAGVWSDDLSVEGFVAASTRLLHDHGLGETMRARGAARVASAPGWDHAAVVHLEAYRRAEERGCGS